jgi:hypothetical protein
MDRTSACEFHGLCTDSSDDDDGEEMMIVEKGGKASEGVRVECLTQEGGILLGCQRSRRSYVGSEEATSSAWSLKKMDWIVGRS